VNSVATETMARVSTTPVLGISIGGCVPIATGPQQCMEANLLQPSHGDDATVGVPARAKDLLTHSLTLIRTTHPASPQTHQHPIDTLGALLPEEIVQGHRLEPTQPENPPFIPANLVEQQPSRMVLKPANLVQKPPKHHSQPSDTIADVSQAEAIEPTTPQHEIPLAKPLLTRAGELLKLAKRPLYGLLVAAYLATAAVGCAAPTSTPTNRGVAALTPIPTHTPELPMAGPVQATATPEAAPVEVAPTLTPLEPEFEAALYKMIGELNTKLLEEHSITMAMREGNPNQIVFATKEQNGNIRPFALWDYRNFLLTTKGEGSAKLSIDNRNRFLILGVAAPSFDINNPVTNKEIIGHVIIMSILNARQIHSDFIYATPDTATQKRREKEIVTYIDAAAVLTLNQQQRIEALRTLSQGDANLTNTLGPTLLATDIPILGPETPLTARQREAIEEIIKSGVTQDYTNRQGISEDTWDFLFSMRQ
jgi:hypothetical protein